MHGLGVQIGNSGSGDRRMHTKPAIATVSAATFFAILLLSPGAVAAPASDACSLLTQAQVSSALGVSVDAGKGPVPKLCQWAQPGNVGADLLKVDLTLIPVEGFTAAKTPNEKTSVTPVGGLGDDAYYFATAAGKFMTIRVMKGSSAFSISVHGGKPSVEQIKAIEKTLAQEALAKL
jgi:hypothetical protein